MSEHCALCAAGVELRLSIVRGMVDLGINYELTNNREVAHALRVIASTLEDAPDSPDGAVIVPLSEGDG